jgi:galactose mutarotase-like enzyme
VPSLLRRKRPPATESQGFGHAELSAGGSRVVLIPELGGKIASLEIAGRQWLWTNPSIPFRTPVPGSSYIVHADSGGYDECFPTVAPCTLPSSVAGFSGVELQDHGELWSQRPSVELLTRPDGQQATMVWTGAKLPYLFTRVVRVDASGAVAMRYAVRNTGTSRLPFIWSSHPLLPLGERTRLILPEGEPVRVYRSERIEMGGTGAEHRWPNIRTPKDTLDLSRPGAIGKRFACKLFFDSIPGIAAIEEEGARLEVRFDHAEVPDFGLWINARGWSPSRRISNYSNLAFEPCIGAPDTLTDALGGWRRAHWLDAGQTREWTLTWTGRPAAG